MQLEDMDVMQQWSFVTTLSKRLHDQHTQVLDFFTAWGVSTASGALVLHPQALRRLLRFLMPDLSLAECAALQVRVCVCVCVCFAFSSSSACPWSFPGLCERE